MKKFLSVISVIAALSMLTACSGANGSSVSESEESSQTESTSQAQQESSETSSEVSVESSEPTESESSEPDKTESNTGFLLCGPGGDNVRSTECTKITAADDADGGAVTASNWLQASVVGFTYMEEPNCGYRRVSTGDKILGFTVGEAECTFANCGQERIGSEAYFSSGYAELVGSATLNGTIRVATDDGFSYSAGDLLFLPDEDSRVLPVMNYSYGSDCGVYTKVDENGNMYPDIIVTAGSNVDASAIPTDGTPVHVLITLDNISMSSSVDVSSNMRAEIAAFEIK